MQSIQLQNDTLIDIATFLVRRWSAKENVTVEFSKIRQNETRLKEKRVSLIPNEQHYGNDFQKYRQFTPFISRCFRFIKPAIAFLCKPAASDPNVIQKRN